MSRYRRRLFWVLLLPVLFVVESASAHRSGVPYFLSLDVVGDIVEIEVETDPLFAGIQNAPREALDASPEQTVLLEKFFSDSVEILSGGEVVPWVPKASSCRFEPPAEDDPEEPVHIIAHFQMPLPEGAEDLGIRLSPLTGATLLAMLNVEGQPSRRHAILFPGEKSKPWKLPDRSVPEEGAQPGSVKGDERTERFDEDGDSLNLFWHHLVEGFRHVLPLGWDHALFVLALFFLSRKWKPLLLQVTTFTVAHSITLALAAKGMVDLPAHVVEPIIALSIAVVALENLFHDKLAAWRVLIVFIFGLFHGLGFAGQFAELPIPEGSFLLAVAAFNVGVELAQIAIVVGAWLILWPLAKRHWYRPWVVRPACLAIGALGLWWALSRIFF